MSEKIGLAKVAYEAYVKRSAGVSLVSGAKLPAWDAVDTSIQAAWMAAAMAVRAEVIG